MRPCSSREQRSGLLVLVLVLLQRDIPDKGPAEALVINTPVSLQQNVWRLCPLPVYKINPTSPTSDLVFPSILNTRRCACYGLLSLTSLTSISATAWQLAQRRSHPHSLPPTLSVLQHLCYPMDPCGPPLPAPGHAARPR